MKLPNMTKRTPVSSADENVQDDYQPYVDAPDESDETPMNEDYAGGSTPPSLSMPDESPKAEVLQQFFTMLQDALDKERKWIQAQADRDTNNDGAYVKFSRYSIVANQPQQICREMRHRGDVTITSFGAGDVYIGTHVGIIVGGSDTGRISGGASRTVYTRVALWAVSNADCEIDVQEEFT